MHRYSIHIKTDTANLLPFFGTMFEKCSIGYCVTSRPIGLRYYTISRLFVCACAYDARGSFNVSARHTLVLELKTENLKTLPCNARSRENSIPLFETH